MAGRSSHVEVISLEESGDMNKSLLKGAAMENLCLLPAVASRHAFTSYRKLTLSRPRKCVLTSMTSHSRDLTLEKSGMLVGHWPGCRQALFKEGGMDSRGRGGKRGREETAAGAIS